MKAADIDGGQVTKARFPAGEHEHRIGIGKHVLDQRLRGGRIEKEHHATSPQHPQVGSHDVRAVLRHRHRHHLIRPAKKRLHRHSDLLRRPIKLGIGQPLTGVRHLQGGKLGKAGRRPGKHLMQPPHAPLMRSVDEVMIAEVIGEAKWTGVAPVGTGSPSDNTVAPPGRRRQHKQAQHGGSRDHQHHGLVLSHSRRSRRQTPFSRNTAAACRFAARRG